MKLITLVGRFRTGKDTVATILSTKLGCNSYGIADPIKIGVCEILGVSLEKLEEIKDQLVTLPDGTKVTVRSIIVGYGKKLKEFHGLDCFLDKLKEKILDDPNKFAIIRDCRLVREDEYLKRHFNCTSIKTLREVEINKDSYDLTEVETDIIKCDYTIENNGTMEELHEKLENTLKEFYFKEI